MTDPTSAPGPVEALRDEPFEPEIVQSDRVYQGYVWDVRSERFRYGDDEIVREFVAHTGAVAVVALDDDGRMLLIQQYRHPIRHRDWELPAGLLDVEGEDSLDAAKRELAEEADLVARDWRPLVSSWTTPGGNDEMIHIYLATGVDAAPETFAREHEEADMRLEWVPLSEVVEGVLAGRLHNGILTIGALAAARTLRV